MSGCHGGSSSIPSTPEANSEASQTNGVPARINGSGTMVVVLPTIVDAKPLPTPGAGKAVFLSSGTQSVSGSFGKTTFGPIDVSAASSNCKAVSGGRSCTISVPVAAGVKMLQLTTFGAQASFGRLAFVPKTRIKVLPNVQNYVKPLKWFGVASGVKITASRAKLTQFQPAQVVLTVTGVDGSGARIPEINLVYAQGGGFSTQTTASGPYTQSLDVVTFTPTVWNYDGRSKGTEVFTSTGLVNKKAVATGSVKVKIGPGNATTIGQIIAASVEESGTNIVEFSSSAVGDVAPLRVLSATGSPYGATDDGNFWMATQASAQQFDNIGDVLGSIPSPVRGQHASANTVDSAQNEYGAYLPNNDDQCLSKLHIFAFAPGSFGKTTTRDLVGAASCPATELAVDGTGVLYAYIAPGYDVTTGTVLEFAPNTTGNVPPALTISNVFLHNLVGDAAGNRYAIQNPTAQTAADAGTLVKFAAGSTTPTTVLPGVVVGAFALDSNGNIYAEVPTPAPPSSVPAFQIEEFLAGTTTASRIIGGSNTTLTTPGGITVLP